jgi:hypothetical protein
MKIINFQLEQLVLETKDLMKYFYVMKNKIENFGKIVLKNISN